MINGSSWLNGLVNINIKKTLFKKHIWHFINTRHRKRLLRTEKYRKDTCILHLKQSLINSIMQRIKFKKFQLMTMKILFNWLPKTHWKNNMRFIKFVNLLTRKCNLGHGTTERSQNYIVTPICQSAKLRKRQT